MLPEINNVNATITYLGLGLILASLVVFLVIKFTSKLTKIPKIKASLGGNEIEIGSDTDKENLQSTDEIVYINTEVVDDLDKYSSQLSKVNNIDHLYRQMRESEEGINVLNCILKEHFSERLNKYILEKTLVFSESKTQASEEYYSFLLEKISEENKKKLKIFIIENGFDEYTEAGFEEYKKNKLEVFMATVKDIKKAKYKTEILLVPESFQEKENVDFINEAMKKHTYKILDRVRLNAIDHKRIKNSLEEKIQQLKTEVKEMIKGNNK